MYQRANVAITFTTAGNKDALDVQGGTITLPSTSLFGFSSTAQASGAQDTGLARASAGVVEINNGTAGTLRDLSLRNLNPTGGNGLAVFTVATLPATAATGLFAGSRVAVSDAKSTTFMSTVAGGGSNFVPVLYTGSAWVIA